MIKDVLENESLYADYQTRILYLPGESRKFEKMGMKKSLPKDYIVSRLGSKVNYCYMIKKGQVIGYEYTKSGEERVYYFCDEGSLMLESNVILNMPSQVNFKTTRPSELVCISREALLKAMEADMEFNLEIMKSISNKFISAMDEVRQANCHNVDWRICDILLILADRYGANHDGKVLITEKISQQKIANVLGINRVTAARSIKHLKDMDLIENINGYYCIRSIEKLKNHQDTIDDFYSKI